MAHTFVLVTGIHQDYQFISLEEHLHNLNNGGYVNSRQQEITVVDEAAAAQYQEAYYWYMQLIWESNLSPEGRDENLAEAKKYEDIMNNLEIKESKI